MLWLRERRKTITSTVKATHKLTKKILVPKVYLNQAKPNSAANYTKMENKVTMDQLWFHQPSSQIM